MKYGDRENRDNRGGKEKKLSRNVERKVEKF